METHKTTRREFIRKSAAITGSIGLAGTAALAGSRTPSHNKDAESVGNRLPEWKGFNVLDFFSADPSRNRNHTTEEDLKWMRDWGFDFIRIPMAYPSYLDFDRSRDIRPDEVYQVSEEALETIDRLVFLARQYGMHVSLNLHRAPGYCINAGFHEPYNLWKDREAQDAFYWHWQMWARRYRDMDSHRISFDLLNEPAMIGDMNDQYSSKTILPGDLYVRVAEEAAKVIWNENPGHLVIADGNDVGSKVIPGLTHLPIGQSCRGYYPHIISHYGAGWVYRDPDNMPPLKYPGEVDGHYLSREMLEDYYAPWIELVRSGTGVHCGECGCYNRTPHPIFLDWFGDVLDILGSGGIGFALWNFRGAFGILDSGRRDVDYEDWYGHRLDRRLLDLLLSS